MFVFLSSCTRRVLPLALCATLAGCGAFNSATQRVAQSVTPYRPEVVQGNFVSSEQVQLLKVGLTRAQVKELLGTPLLSSVFRSDRWEYVFELKRQGVPPQGRKLTVFFKGDAVEKFTGDTMPTEAEFVASLANLRKDIQAPPLEATAQALAAATSAAAPVKAAAAPELAPLPVNYPPLEGAATP